MTRVGTSFETYHLNQSKAQAWPITLTVPTESITNGAIQLGIPRENEVISSK